MAVRPRPNPITLGFDRIFGRLRGSDRLFPECRGQVPGPSRKRPSAPISTNAALRRRHPHAPSRPATSSGRPAFEARGSDGKADRLGRPDPFAPARPWATSESLPGRRPIDRPHPFGYYPKTGQIAARPVVSLFWKSPPAPAAGKPPRELPDGVRYVTAAGAEGNRCGSRPLPLPGDGEPAIQQQVKQTYDHQARDETKSGHGNVWEALGARRSFRLTVT